MKKWKTAWFLAWMLVWAAEDIRKRQICFRPALFALLSGIVWQLAGGALFTWDVLGGILGGGFFWIFSCLSGERMGKGDALAILCMGLYMGMRVGLAALMLAFFLSSGAALYLLLVKKKTSRYAMPFLPFLAAAAWLAACFPS